MNDLSERDEQEAAGEKPSLWTRLFRTVLPGKMGRRWERLSEGSQQDAAHYNMRSGL